MLDYYISKAIRCCGSQIKLARRMGVKPERVSYLLNSARKISIEDAILIERATDNKITRHQLLQGLSSVIKQQLEGKVFEIRNLPISERVKQGIAYEEALKDRKCHFDEQNKAENILLSRQNFDAKKYRTDVVVAKYVHLGNHQSYRDAKCVLEKGSAALIRAMDDKKIGISTAAKLTQYSLEDQEKILKLTRKEIIAYIKKKSLVDKDEFVDISFLWVIFSSYLILKNKDRR